MPVSTINNWENGRTFNPPAAVYPKIYRFLGYVPYQPAAPINKKLMIWRRVSGLTQSELARMTGVDPSILGYWEAGVRKPGKRMVSEVVQVLTAVGDDFVVAHRSN